MNQRERFLATFNYGKIDRVPDMEFGYWKETIEQWYTEGLPTYIPIDSWTAELYFGLEQRTIAPINAYYCPEFKEKLIEDQGEHLIMQDGDGIIYKKNKKGGSIPQYLKYPIETREDGEKIKKERLDPHQAGRYPDNWDTLKKGWANRDYPLAVQCVGIYGPLRNWMGVENISIALAMDPDWIKEMMNHMADMNIIMLEKAVTEVQFDFSSWWEDMCFNKGPLMSPKMFEEIMVPCYKKVTDFLGKHGIKINMLDCDGRTYELIPGWIESGINCMFPVEASCVDPLEIRKKFGKKVLMSGGVNKLSLIAGKEAIDKEMKRLEPLIKEGGFIPHIDHRCPPDVTLENYKYYLEKKRKMIGRI